MTVWLHGDRIFRGAAPGRFPESYSPAEIEAEPLWPLRAPAETIARRAFGWTGPLDDQARSRSRAWVS